MVLELNARLVSHSNSQWAGLLPRLRFIEHKGYDFEHKSIKERVAWSKEHFRHN